jgi:mannose-1-phosphate guanylyltransferase/mannose-6-phosphate isomerase
MGEVSPIDMLPPPAGSSPPNMALVVPVILSGGSGTRLWPVSRKSFPKQLWQLISAHTMVQETVLRAVGAGFAPLVIVCNEEHCFLIAEQLREAGITDARIILEPWGRNSAPAVAAAALLVAEEQPDAVIWMMAADSAITKPDALATALTDAVAAARAGRFVTFGMRPTAPEAGYGYIEVGEELPGFAGVHAVAHFVEKPDAAKAAAMMADGQHRWNSGMFVFTAASHCARLAPPHTGSRLVGPTGARRQGRSSRGGSQHQSPFPKAREGQSCHRSSCWSLG